MTGVIAQNDDCLTWRAPGSFELAPSDLHSAAAEPGPSPRGTRSFGPAQKQNAEAEPYFIHRS